MRFDEKGEQVPTPKWFSTDGAPVPDDISYSCNNHMIQIDTLIVDLKKISERFGNTCIYIRRGGLSWGAVALNREADDDKNGVFDLQAQHDRDMKQRLDQVGRLIAERDGEREARWKSDAALRQRDAAMTVLYNRLDKAGVDYSDLIP